ncbi:MAG: glycogen debranching protein GlgX [Ilumatobacteraceae bacterium]
MLQLPVRRPGALHEPRRLGTPRAALGGGQSYFDWGHDRPPQTPWHDTVVYETHVRGLTMRAPDVPERLRGTYSGLAHPAVVDYLVSLGVTAVELMPVHSFIQDHFLIQKGLTNYWGYNTIGFFAPNSAYALGPDPVSEFKAMVHTLHEAGLEVILDVVYNHTAEGNHLGPTLCFKGIDNPSYYRLVPGAPAHYFDYTGTGNSMNMRHPNVLQLIMDSLRYWVTEMHVDGFRFDLASTLARELHEVDRLSAFFDLIQQDPVVSRVKLIAEPWDLGEGGYQVGNFPWLWREWNGKYRDSIRDFWRGEGSLAEFAVRLAGSSDLYADDGRNPLASINFITAHDGFTLNDLVSYNDRHNAANGEENRDGESHNRSWNCGHEGPTTDRTILALRHRQRRNLLATMFLSQGVPMLLGGDEFGRTQRGTTTPTARTTSCPGTTGTRWTRTSSPSPNASSSSARITRSSVGGASSQAGSTKQPEPATSPGSAPAAGSCATSTGTCPNRALAVLLDGRSLPGGTAASRSSTTSSSPSSTGTGSRSSSSCHRAASRPRGWSSSTRAIRVRVRTDAVQCVYVAEGRSVVVLRAVHT